MYDYYMLEGDSPPSAGQLEDLSVDGWDLVCIVMRADIARTTYLTYLRKEATSHDGSHG